MNVLHLCSYVPWILGEVVKGSWNVMRDTITPGVDSTPMIVELPLRCRSDLEITAMASSITITPGTLVVGTASAHNGVGPSLFVQSLYVDSREQLLADLRDMESRLLRVTRGRAADAPGADPASDAKDADDHRRQGGGS